MVPFMGLLQRWGITEFRRFFEKTEKRHASWFRWRRKKDPNPRLAYYKDASKSRSALM
jgi:hypothetical protein